MNIRVGVDAPGDRLAVGEAITWWTDECADPIGALSASELNELDDPVEHQPDPLATVQGRLLSTMCAQPCQRLALALTAAMQRWCTSMRLLHNDGESFVPPG